MPVAGDEEVLGLEVAVDDPLVVGGGQAARDLHARISTALRTASGPPVSRLAQGLALEQLRDDVGRALVDADVVDGEDVGDGSGRPAARASCSKRRRRSASPGERDGQDLDRDLAPQARVVGAIDLAHSAGTQGGDDFVRAQSASREWRHGAVSGRGSIAGCRAALGEERSVCAAEEARAILRG